MHISEQVNTRKKHPILRVVLVLLLIIVIAVIVLVVKQRENLQAVVDSRTYSTEELTGKIADSKQQVEQAISGYDTPIMRDFTLEEEEKIRKGQLSPEEAVKLIMAPAAQPEDTAGADSTAAESSTGDTQQTSAPSQAKSQPAVTADSIVAKYLEQVYGLKAHYLGELGRVEGEMRAAYKASGKNKAAIAGIVQNYMPEVGALESECDGQISSLLSGMRSELSAIGADTSIADKIYDAYLNEKSLKKAYYLSKY